MISTRTTTTNMRKLAATLLAVVLVLTAGCGGAEARKARYLAKGEELMAAQNYEKARLEYRNAIQIDPKDATARVRAGEAAEKLGNYSEAAQMYKSAIAADEKNTQARAYAAGRHGRGSQGCRAGRGTGAHE